MSNTPAKIINLADRRARKEDESRNAPIPGWIIWLHCPKCKSLEYSEIEMPDGRVHKCGTVVEEEEVQIDVRAEYTISLRNSLRLDVLFKQTKIPGFLKPLAKKGIGMLENLQAAEEECLAAFPPLRQWRCSAQGHNGVRQKSKPYQGAL